MLSETTISSGYSTVIPAKVRKQLDISPGDILIWDIEGGELRLRPRKKESLQDIVGIISKGGDAVDSKRRIQRGSR
jgi:AbrB family looped-hinge helix DNA binding protein